MEQVYRIGIDHGYGNIKTAHHIFESGVIERERESELAGMTVEFEGKFYEIGSTHKEYQMDKVWDEDYKTGKLDDTGKDIYQDIAYPVTRQFRQELYDEVVKEFHAAMGQETQQTEGE